MVCIICCSYTLTHPGLPETRNLECRTPHRRSYVNSSIGSVDCRTICSVMLRTALAVGLRERSVVCRLLYCQHYNVAFTSIICRTVKLTNFVLFISFNVFDVMTFMLHDDSFKCMSFQQVFENPKTGYGAATASGD